MNIDKILYETTRSIYSVEDKMSIASIILFCYKLGNLKFSELLYTEDHSRFIESLNDEYNNYEIDLSVRLNDKNVRDCFNATIKKVAEKYDQDGYLKALFNRDEFAVTIEGIINTDFSKALC